MAAGPPTEAAMAKAKPKLKPKKVNLALQGGGAHGAYTWGVLDRLLEDERLEIDGVSGTSAGAMNAAVLADGYERDGRDGARKALEAFWRRISDAGRYSPLQPTPIDRMLGGWNMDNSPSFAFFDWMVRTLSPYQFNPLNHNPLRNVLIESIDFDRLSKASKIKLFLSATNVRTGKVKVFSAGEISADALLASACLPFMFQTVVIDGEPYWDGGYMGNPSLFPLIYGADSQDVIIVQVNPLGTDTIPRTAHEIMNRVNEISFNSSLMREMRAVSFVTQLLDSGQLDDARYRRMYVHWIDAEEEMRGLGVSSKLNADLDFLLHLRDIGRQTADAWLVRHFDRIGLESTIDIRAKFL
jgi:NTE family protein